MIRLKWGVTELLFILFAQWIPLVGTAKSASDTLWIEAENFENLGGWVNDSQFVDTMGSPYLLANGAGVPVEDAVTQADIFAPGKYRLWVRCKDWLPSHSPGQFQVVINGVSSSSHFGQSEKNQWKWTDGGQFDLEKGTIEIRLHDRSGWWGRCDALVLSADPAFQPADDLYALEVQRIRYFDPYQHVEESRSYDVVVVGGGLAGCAAAIESARQGFSVVLIQDRPVLGGNASSEIDVPPGGDNPLDPLDPHETGIMEEFYHKPDRGFGYDWSSALEKVVRAEANIDLRLETRAMNTVMENPQQIKAILALDVKNNRRLLFPGKIFIDCTGDGWLGFWSGAVFRQGREARSEFNESLAPEQSDSHTMGNTLFVAQFKEGDSTPFACPDWAYQWKSPEDFEQAGQHFSLNQIQVIEPDDQDGLTNRFTYGSGLHGRQYVYDQQGLESINRPVRTMPATPYHYSNREKGKGYNPQNKNGGFFQWYVELGGMQDTIADAESIRDELFRINLGLWNYAKNYDPKFKEQNKDRRLTWINYAPGKRESRRLMGDYILTQWDYADQIIHEDNIAYGGWGVDIHHPNGFWKSGPMYYSAYHGQKISIPFRSLYSKNIENLMMAGRDISVSHVALGGVRVMKTTCLMGQATGMAAAVCLEKSITPREADQTCIHEIQQRLMKNGVYIMGQKNDDPNDLARQARVSASSRKTISDPKTRFPESDTPLIHDLNTPRAVMFQPGKEQIEQISLYLRSSNTTPTPITMVLREAAAFGDFSSQTDLATVTASVPASSQGWISFPLNASVKPDRYYFVFLPPQKGLRWDLFPTLIENTCRAYGGPNWILRKECYKFSLTAETDSSPDVSMLTLQPENVIDGYSRSVDFVPHSWGPDPRQATPQWILLHWEKPVTFNTVHISFQNYAYACSDYRLEIQDGIDGKPVAAVTTNDQRRNVCSFSEVTTQDLRLILNAPALGKPDDSAQVCEIRVYQENHNSSK